MRKSPFTSSLKPTGKEGNLGLQLLRISFLANPLRILSFRGDLSRHLFSSSSAGALFHVAWRRSENLLMRGARGSCPFPHGKDPSLDDLALRLRPLLLFDDVNHSLLSGICLAAGGRLFVRRHARRLFVVLQAEYKALLVAAPMRGNVYRCSPPPLPAWKLKPTACESVLLA